MSSQGAEEAGANDNRLPRFRRDGNGNVLSKIAKV